MRGVHRYGQLQDVHRDLPRLPRMSGSCELRQRRRRWGWRWRLPRWLRVCRRVDDVQQRRFWMFRQRLFDGVPPRVARRRMRARAHVRSRARRPCPRPQRCHDRFGEPAQGHRQRRRDAHVPYGRWRRLNDARSWRFRRRPAHRCRRGQGRCCPLDRRRQAHRQIRGPHHQPGHRLGHHRRRRRPRRLQPVLGCIAHRRRTARTRARQRGHLRCWRRGHPRGRPRQGRRRGRTRRCGGQGSSLAQGLGLSPLGRSRRHVCAL
mmetsp:Transcript_11393/g.29186  ORF Transcript_11393/g.29186 Transcript_11393/m.29186 type:complete len:262 (-) Transcript_11393:319-1104(-)